MKKGRKYTAWNVLKGCLRTEGNYRKFQNKDAKAVFIFINKFLQYITCKNNESVAFHKIAIFTLCIFQLFCLMENTVFLC